MKEAEGQNREARNTNRTEGSLAGRVGTTGRSPLIQWLESQGLVPVRTRWMAFHDPVATLCHVMRGSDVSCLVRANAVMVAPGNRSSNRGMIAMPT
jgi:hypothetical protein